jgi:ADP-heptose:LPS heptosyltransferase
MNNYILISPWSKELRDKSYNPKNYPHWPEVVEDLKNDYEIIQIGVTGEKKLVDDFRINLTLKALGELLLDPKCYSWISVDNFLPHLAHVVGKEPGVVLWGISDPNIFGYKENKNLLKARKYLREHQFGIWDGLTYDPKVFVTADRVIEAVRG